MRSSRLVLMPALALLMVAGTAPAALAADATIDQVYSAARAGQVDQALSLMQPVLKDHPNSAKAHYVEAELLARQGKIDEARVEFSRAQQIAPGLPFASAHSVSELKRQLQGGHAAAAVPAAGDTAPASQGHFPWLPVIVIGGLLLGLLALLRRRRPVQEVYVGQAGGPGYGAGYGGPGYGPQGGPGYGAPGYGGPGYGAPQGGMGSGIMGGLAQGAAMGAGFAAGERVVDGLFGGHDREREREAPARQDGGWDQGGGNAGFGGNTDMGGDDFGISDSGSWDDSSGGGNDGW
ncbi:MAG TPA: tetratricopeptide repeat protein [Novosphingobium sp.]|nr:tetratricopeptide repeat protein [Novosphingobium sp.]